MRRGSGVHSSVHDPSFDTRAKLARRGGDRKPTDEANSTRGEPLRTGTPNVASQPATSCIRGTASLPVDPRPSRGAIQP